MTLKGKNMICRCGLGKDDGDLRAEKRLCCCVEGGLGMK